MPPSDSIVTYYGPYLTLTPLIIRATDESTGLVSLSRPDSDEIIVTDVPLVLTPAIGCAVAESPAAPLEKPKKAKRE